MDRFASLLRTKYAIELSQQNLFVANVLDGLDLFVVATILVW